MTPRTRKPGRRRPTGATAQFDAYLASRPESDPRVLLPRSAPLLARGAFLLHGVLVLDWSVAWLTAFFFAEFFVVVRLAVLGDRLSAGRKRDPVLHRTTSLGFQLFWLVVTLAAFVYTGQGLERSTRDEGFDVGGGGLLAWPGWGMLAYLGFLLGEFVFDLRAARRAKRPFASAGLLQASFFFFAVIVLSFFGIFLAGVFGQVFGDAGPRGVLAVLLVIARTGSELAVLWIPLWGPGQLARVAAKARAERQP